MAEKAAVRGTAILGLQALATYKENGLIMPGDRMYREIAARLARIAREEE